ncbi:MAG: Ig-like domain repeat protein [Acidobacteriota bacterium]
MNRVGGIAIVLGWLSCAAVAQRTIRVPADAATIQGAIKQAQAGDTVLVSPGTYKEALDFGGTSVLVRSVDLTRPDLTVLNVTGNQVGVTIAHGEQGSAGAGLEGFTVTGAHYVAGQAVIDQGGCGVYVQGATPLIARNVMQSNTFGICLFGGAVNVISNVVQDNTLGGVLSSNADDVVIRDNVVYENGNSQIPRSAGGMKLAASHGLRVEQNVISNNAGHFGAIDLTVTDSGVDEPRSIWIRSNTIVDNALPDSNAKGWQVHVTGFQNGVTIANNIVEGDGRDPTFPQLGPSQQLMLELAQGSFPANLDHNSVLNVPITVGPALCLPLPAAFSPDGVTFGNQQAVSQVYGVSPARYCPPAGTPVADRGNNSAVAESVDIDGRARIVDNTGAGYAVMDMGACELLGGAASVLTPVVVIAKASPRTVDYGNTMTLSATVSAAGGVPTGTVTFSLNNTVVAVALLDATGHATAAVNRKLPTGYAGMTATYGGSSTLATGVSTVEYVLVNKGPTTTTLTSSLNPSHVGQAVTFSVRVVAGLIAADGQVLLSADGVTLATLTLASDGTATYTTSALAAGRHTMVATYQGTAVLAPSKAQMVQAVSAVTGSYHLEVEPNPVTIVTLHHATVTVRVVPTADFADTLELSCGPLPEWATCTFAQSTVNVQGKPAEVSLIVDTSGVPGFYAKEWSGGSTWWAGLAMMPLLLLRRRRRGWLAAVVVVALAGVSGCSSHYPDSTPPGTYTLQVQSVGTLSYQDASVGLSLVVTR